LLSNGAANVLINFEKKKSKVLVFLSLIRNFASRYGIYAELQREIAGADNATGDGHTECYARLVLCW
jgi:hypothetical protein